ncbi:uncharacterized protein GIQ15_01754 [Arthroderma uncinatum]|uniref:uncharacterized protein n=1 Tax=Arthroderma uncinatum TaxID=74035 RepID=UPI00144A7CAF|nr:uncharacterized protein GIQ15_01754 [Arthroderma uncinatum]KAF3492237.1 hypothetical protein GIQ15_01754 [Arthroderma uncinatum]
MTSQNTFSRELCYAGPVVTSPASGGPSQTRRCRRILGASQVADQIFHGDSEVHSEDFRCGGPVLATLPAATENIIDEHPLQVRFKKSLRKEVLAICRKWSIRLDKARNPSPVLVRRASDTDFNPAPEEWLDTVLIYAKRKAIDDLNWFEACREIRQVFLREQLAKLNVEIIDRSRSRDSMKAFPLLGHNDLIENWNYVRSAILEVLADREWVLLYPIVREDTRKGERIKTISVTVREDTTDDWTHSLDQIVNILNDRLLFDVAVEIHRGSILHAPPSPLDSRGWRDPTCLGGSVGHRDCRESSGTFGGYLELELPDGTWKEFGVTCFHCVVPQKGIGIWGRFGVHPDNRYDNIQIDHPSRKHHEFSLKWHSEMLDEEKREMAAMEKEARKTGQTSPGVDMDYIRWPRENVNENSRLLKQATQFVDNGKNRLGRVYAASGLRTNEQSRFLDWALIDVKNERKGLNEIPRNEDKSTCRMLREHRPLPKYLYDSTQPLLSYALLMKEGHRTGQTTGIVDAIREADIQFWIPNKLGTLISYTGKAYLITPVSDRTFGNFGDSGSFMVGSKGSLAGLYVGGDRHNGIGLFTKTSDLFEDIKEVTRARSIRVPGEEIGLSYPALVDTMSRII